MEVHVALVPELAGDISQAVCIVIDVLRATTVIPTLFERRCPRVYVAGAHETARKFARERGYVLCGETDGYRVPDFDYGNSPREFSRLDFAERPVVLSTTNGTKATAVVSGARRVYLGAAVNRMAVAEAAWEYAGDTDSDIVVVCSGTNDRYTLEDAVVAGMYVEALAGQAGVWKNPEQSDAAIACRRLWEQDSNLLRSWMGGIHARRLTVHGFGEDLGFCAAIDTLPHVPTLVAETEAESTSAPVILIRA